MKTTPPDTKKLMETSYYWPVEFQKASLSSSQRELLVIVIKYGPVTAPIIASINEISEVNASTQLKSLSDRGFLNRKKIAKVSGGYMFQYRCDPKKWG